MVMPTTKHRALQDWDTLLAQLKEFDEEAIERFCQHYYPRLCHFFHWRGLRLEDAEDLTQECLYDILFAKLGQYRQTAGSSFDAWFWAVVRHQMVDWFRCQVQPADLAEPLGPNDFSERPEELELALPDAERWALAEQYKLAQAEAMRAALEYLPPSQRAVIVLHDLEGDYSYQEIADLLGVPVGTVRVWHHRALNSKALRNALKQEPQFKRQLARCD